MTCYHKWKLSEMYRDLSSLHRAIDLLRYAGELEPAGVCEALAKRLREKIRKYESAAEEWTPEELELADAAAKEGR